MGISWWWLNEFDTAMLALVLAAARRRGAGPERLCAAVMVGMEALDLVYHFIVGRGAFHESVDIGHLVIDLAAGAAFLFVALKANRIYPLWMAALQLTSVLAHFAREANPHAAGLAYAYLGYGPFYLELVVLFAGIALHARRVRRKGTYRSWRVSSSRLREQTRKP
jgi:hypothetical protein